MSSAIVRSGTSSSDDFCLLDPADRRSLTAVELDVLLHMTGTFESNEAALELLEIRHRELMARQALEQVFSADKYRPDGPTATTLP